MAALCRDREEVGRPAIPVASACAARGIPFQSAREELASFWRARETQALLNTLEAEGPTTTRRAIEQRLAEPGPGPWAELLSQALEELLLEEPDATVLPVAYVRSWLGEWSRDVRRRQRGLLLTTAHQAKGLEFDHAVILDGKWNAVSREEDDEAPRRLYYVAMTRARQTLALLRVDDPSSNRPPRPTPPTGERATKSPNRYSIHSPARPAHLSARLPNPTFRIRVSTREPPFALWRTWCSPSPDGGLRTTSCTAQSGSFDLDTS